MFSPPFRDGAELAGTSVAPRRAATQAAHVRVGKKAVYGHTRRSAVSRNGLNGASAQRDDALEAGELVLAVNEIAEGITHVRTPGVGFLVQREALGPALPTHLQKIAPQFPR